MFQRATPLTEQLIQQLSADITAGTITGENNRLPSEAELCERYGVSRATLREALAKLELAGAIVRRHGVGTFVHRAVQSYPGMISTWLDEAPAFMDLIRQSGFEPRCQVLRVETAPAGRLGEIFGVSASVQLVVIEKRIFADLVPVIYSITRCPPDYIGFNAATVEMDSPLWQQPIYSILAVAGQRQVRHQGSELQAATANEAQAAVLECSVGNALLCVDETGYGAEGEALFHGLHYFRGDRISFRQIRIPTFAVVPTTASWRTDARVT